MPSFNLHLAKHPCGKPLCESEIKLGLRVLFPSGLGGVVNAECKTVKGDDVTFVSLNQDWPLEFNIKLNQADLCDEEFVRVLENLRDMRSNDFRMVDQHTELMIKATSLGYLNRMSSTQSHLTERAYNRILDLQDR